MIDTRGTPLRTLERRLERAISDYLAVSRSGDVFAHTAARDQAEQEAWDRLMEARAQVEARRAEIESGDGAAEE